MVYLQRANCVGCALSVCGKQLWAPVQRLNFCSMQRWEGLVQRWSLCCGGVCKCWRALSASQRLLKRVDSDLERVWWDEGGSSPPTLCSYRALVYPLVFVSVVTADWMNRLLLSIASDQTEVLIGYLYLSGHLFPPKHEFSLGDLCRAGLCFPHFPPSCHLFSSEIPAVELILHFVILDYSYCP